MEKEISIELPQKFVSFKEFRVFLAENCFEGNVYLKGKYDRKIFNWFVKK